MTIGAWVGFGFIALCIVGGCILAITCIENNAGKALVIIFALFIIIAILLGMRWWFGNTAAGRRALTDEKSNLKNGIERVITVYTADGKELAKYKGKIDIEANDGGYIKFDFDGKRYIYYNCFVESIAEIP